MTSTATTGQITLDIQSVDVLSYAMAHNGLAVVGQVRITNGPDVGGALLRIGVRDAQGDLAKPCEVVVDLARCGGPHRCGGHLRDEHQRRRTGGAGPRRARR